MSPRSCRDSSTVCTGGCSNVLALTPFRSRYSRSSSLVRVLIGLYYSTGGKAKVKVSSWRYLLEKVSGRVHPSDRGTKFAKARSILWQGDATGFNRRLASPDY